MYLVTFKEQPGSTPIVVHNPYVDGIKLVSGNINQGVNNIDSFDLEVDFSNEGYGRIKPMQTLVEVRNVLNNYLEFSGRLVNYTDSMSSDGLHSKVAICEGVLGYLHDSHQPYIDFNGTAENLFIELINNHNSKVESYKRFTIGTVSLKTKLDRNGTIIQNNTNSKNTTTTAFITPEESTFELIKTNLLDVFGGEIQVRIVGTIMYIDYVDSIGRDSYENISLSRNLRSVTKKVDPSSIVTRLIPLGKTISTKDEKDNERRLTITSVNGGSLYIEKEDLKNMFGIQTGSFVWNDVDKADVLKTKGTEWLNNQKTILQQFTVEAVDLFKIGRGVEEYNVGNTHKIENPIMGINERIRIVSKKVDIVDPVNSSLTVGDKFKSMVDYQVEQRNTGRAVTKIQHKISDMGAAISQLQANDGVEFAKSYGLGTDAKTLPDTDPNLIVETGFYYIPSSNPFISNMPNPSAHWLIHMEFGSGAVQLVFRNSASTTTHYRRKSSDIWQSWYEHETTVGAQNKADTAETNATEAAIDYAKGYGLGTNAVTIPDTDPNLIEETGFYYIPSSNPYISNMPSTSSYWLIHMEYGTGGVQLAFKNSNASTMHHRRKSSDVWQSWYEYETITGSQSKADTAETNAVNYAKNYGLGTVSKTLPDEDPNLIMETGFYYIPSTNPYISNMPSASSYWLIHMRYGSGAIQMIFKSSNTSTFHHRRKGNDIWQDWYEYETTVGAQSKVDAGIDVANEYTDQALANKVDKVAGKVLSTNDYTTTEKNKLAGIEDEANKYIHPSSHPASMITESTSKRFVSDSQIASWDNAETNAKDFAKSFGLGTNAKAIPTEDPNLIEETGFYYMTSSNPYISNMPGVVSYWIVHIEYGSGAIQMAFKNSNTPTAHYRRKASDVWQSWYEYETTVGAQSKVDAGVATAKAYADQKIADLIATAPAALDTLKELATALGNDANFSTTMTNALANKVDKVAGKGLSTNDYTTTEKNKLAGIADGANNYTHPSSHSPSIIAQDTNNRFVSDSEKNTWNAKETTTIQSVVAPTLTSPWSNYGAGWSTAGYYKDRSRVYLTGTIASGTTGTTIFTLPVGYRPAATLNLPTDTNSGHGSMRIYSDGRVVLSSGGTTWVSLDAVSFRV